MWQTTPWWPLAMPFISTRARLSLTDKDEAWLTQLSHSRSESVARVQRATILLRYFQGQTVSAIAAALQTNRPKVERCISKALDLGARPALRDLPGRGRPPGITDDDKAWVVNLACQKPKELGYAQELWTTRLLSKHVRKHCEEAGHASLRKLGRGTVSKILSAHPVRPHKIQYYLERRDADFEAKMIEVLHVYKDVEVWRKIESFFGKLAKTLLRGIRVSSKAELRARIELYFQELNEEPTVFKWKYKLETLETESVVPS